MGCGSSTDAHDKGTLGRLSPTGPTTPSTVSLNLAVPTRTEKPRSAQSHKHLAIDNIRDVDAKPLGLSSTSIRSHSKSSKSQVVSKTTPSISKKKTDAVTPTRKELDTKRGSHLKVAKVPSKNPVKSRLRVATAGKRRRKKSSEGPPTLSEQVQQVLCGNMSIECPVNAKTVRIFTSSTFTDTRHERNFLMERVYPKLRSFCQERGYNFQVVDMRWGIRDEATNDHMTTELCMRELRECQKLSTGPNFVTFLSHKYGYRPFPRVIEAAEFEKLLSSVADEESELLLEKWFKKDDNAVPPAYTLLPISHHLPDFVNKSGDSDAFQQAKNTWWQENDKMGQALYDAAIEHLDSEEDRLKYVVSVTEREITEGILKGRSQDKHCLWFKRTIKNIEDQENSHLLSRYMDTRGPEGVVQEARKMLKELKEQKLPASMPAEGVIEYTVNWEKEGIDPGQYPAHKKYIDQLCQDFETHIKRQIEAGIEEKARMDLINEPLYEEILQHTSFCQEKCGTFHGREDTLQKVQQYMSSASSQPFVVYGQSGCGKTSIMAKAAEMCWQWTAGKCVVVLRFIGTTPESSNIRPLLASVISQIKKAYGNSRPTPTDIKGLVRELNETLRLAKAKKSLVIVLDSLDQFDPEGGARQLGWLPTTLPPNVKLLVSTLPEKQYECLPRLQMLLKEQTSQFLEVPQVPEADVRSILNKWLQLERRTLTGDQLQIVVSAFRNCPLPLYLKLCFDEACKWRSFSAPEVTRLDHTIREVIDTLFSNVEKSHGMLLTSHALAYMTLSRSGLTEAELEDILSCDDEVLNDVYQYWTPPVRRLPPLLIVRIKADLQQYLVERGADGVKVIYWYHRQFIEAAKDRYCSNDKERCRRHSAIAEYFMGTWAGKAKPYVDPKSKKQVAKDRLVAAQPLKFETAYNLRKLMELPLHLMEAKQLTELKEHVLLNLDWLLAKLQAASFRDIVDDFNMARNTFPKDAEIRTTSQLLQLSREAITTEPAQLPGQILGRVDASAGLSSLRRQCQEPPVPAIIPDKVMLMAPGGQLKFMLRAHESDVTGLTLTTDGVYAVTVGSDCKVKIWDIQEGKLIRAIEDLDTGMENLLLCCSDRYIAVDSEQGVTVLRFDSGEVLHKISSPFKLSEDEEIHYTNSSLSMAACGEDRSLLALLVENWLVVVDVESGQRLWQVKDPSFDEEENEEYDSSSYVTGHIGHVAISHERSLRIVDLKTRKFVHNITVFEPPEDDEDDDLTVDAMTFTLDGSKVIVASYMTNDLLMFDVQTGSKVEQVEGNRNDFSEKFQKTLDGRHLYFASGDEICLWDLETKTRTYVLNHHFSIEQVVTQDAKTFVTIGNGFMLRVWDMSEEENTEKPRQPRSPAKPANVKQTGEQLNFENVSSVKMVTNPLCCRYAVLYLNGSNHSKEEEKDQKSHDQLIVYDFCQDKCVRSAKINLLPKSDESDGYASRTRPRLRCWKIVDATSVLCSVNRKLKLLDLASMKFTRIFPGKLHKYSDNFVISGNSTVAVALTRSRKNLKVIDIKKGKTTAVIESGRHKRYQDDMVINKAGSLAVVEDEDAILWVVDLQSQQFLHSLAVPRVKNPDDYNLNLYEAVMTNDGENIILNLTMEFEGLGSNGYTTCPTVWNLRSGDLLKEFLDRASMQNASEERDISSDTLLVLDDNTLAAACDDGVVRLWDINSGTLVKRLVGRTSEMLELSRPADPATQRYMLSTSNISENYISLWDLKTHTCRASLRTDFDWKTVHPVGDGSIIKLLDENSKEMVTLKLCGPNEGKTFNAQTDFPKPVLKGTKLGVELETLSPSDDKDDPNDLDQEDDEPDDEDDDDLDFGDDDDDFGFDDDSSFEAVT